MTHETIALTRSEGQHQESPIVYLVDDDPSFLRALSRRLRAADYRVETFGSAEEFLKGDRSEAAGCMVLELQMPGLSGLELQEALSQSEEPLPVVFFTAHGDVSSSVRAMKQGAVDFLTKPVRGNELLEAVQRALARGAAERQMRRKKREWRARYERLTPREREVLALVVDGLANKQIADVLGTTERTIKAHRRQVMHKTGVQSPVELGRAVEWLSELFGPGVPLFAFSERRESDRYPKVNSPLGCDWRILVISHPLCRNIKVKWRQTGTNHHSTDSQT